MSNLMNYSPTIKEELQKEFILGICQTLKIDNPAMYTIGTIKELTKFLKPEQYAEFIKSMFNRNNNYKRPLDIVSEVAQEFNKQGKNDFFSDIEEKASLLISKIRKSLTDLDKYLDKENISFNSVSKKLNFSSLRINKKNIFTDKEIVTLLEIASFETWFQANNENLSIGLADLETKLILQMRSNRTKYYFEQKQDNPTIKKLQGTN